MIYGVMDVTMEALASLVTSEQNMNLIVSESKHSKSWMKDLCKQCGVFKNLNIGGFENYLPYRENKTNKQTKKMLFDFRIQNHFLPLWKAPIKL